MAETGRDLQRSIACRVRRAAVALALLCFWGDNDVAAQFGRPTPRPGMQTPTTRAPVPQRRVVPRRPMRKAAELIHRQEPISVNERLLGEAVPGNTRVQVSLSKQRAYLLVGDQIVIDSPVSSGKRRGMTPTGDFTVLEKDPDHASSIYGDFVDNRGRVVRAGVSTRIDSAPSGTRFVGSPMKWFMRLTWDGVGMHIGILPGYPASHGCIRMPPQAAAMFYQRVRIGTPVSVEP